MGFEFKLNPDLMQQIEQMAYRGLENTIDDVISEVKQKMPHESGDLKGSVEKSLVQGATEGYIIVGTDHWHTVEFGSPPHLIEATNKKELSNGSQNFGKTVHHPGNRPNPVMRNALYRKRVLRFKGR